MKRQYKQCLSVDMVSMLSLSSCAWFSDVLDEFLFTKRQRRERHKNGEVNRKSDPADWTRLKFDYGLAAKLPSG